MEELSTIRDTVIGAFLIALAYFLVSVFFVLSGYTFSTFCYEKADAAQSCGPLLAVDNILDFPVNVMQQVTPVKIAWSDDPKTAYLACYKNYYGLKFEDVVLLTLREECPKSR